MKREVKNKQTSIRAKLMNIAKAEKIDFDALLLRYFQLYYQIILYLVILKLFQNLLTINGETNTA